MSYDVREAVSLLRNWKERYEPLKRFFTWLETRCLMEPGLTIENALFDAN